MEDDDGAGVFGGRLAEAHPSGRHMPRKSVQLSDVVPYVARRDLVESRPTELEPEVAEAVSHLVEQEQRFEERQKQVLNTADAATALQLQVRSRKIT